jgi:hypothetical protein
VFLTWFLAELQHILLIGQNIIPYLFEYHVLSNNICADLGKGKEEKKK